MSGVESSETTALTQVRLEIAGLTGRIDQVLIDHRERLAKNETDIATEKADRIAEIRRLETKMENHSLVSEKERATLAANVKDLQNDSVTFDTAINRLWARINSSWARVLQAGAALAAIIALVFSISKG